MDSYNLITILGATATGKTTLATRLAYDIDGEIISGDSRQIYRKMDIGTGKDISEYTVDGKRIPFHLIDIKKAGYQYNIYEYQRDFIEAFNKVHEHGKMPILCGGSGMYLESVLNNYKLINVPKDEDLRNQLEEKSDEELTRILSEYKELHNTTDLETRKRLIRAIEIEKYYDDNPEIDTGMPDIRSIIFGVKFDVNSRRRRITERLHARLEEGMVDEVRGLLDSGIKPERLVYYGLEYKYLTQYITGELEYDTMVERLNVAIHQFAKRQMTWFRRMERNGFKIHWIDGYAPIEEKLERITNTINNVQ